MIGRRRFLALVPPLTLGLGAVRAQPRTRLVGMLMSLPENDPEAVQWVAVLREGLADLGWREGANLRIEVRWAGGDAARGQAHAAELVGLKPDVLLAHGSPMLLATLSVTRSVPIVGVSFGDPVTSGVAASLAKPGGNVTGFSNFEYGIADKWLETLLALAPTLRRVLFLFNPQGLAGQRLRDVLIAATARADLTLVGAAVTGLADIRTAIEDFASNGGGLIVQPDFITSTHREPIVSLAARFRLPAVYPFKFFAKAGGLATFGIETDDMYRPAAGYVDRILRGEKAGDLPIQLPTRYQFAINLGTAKTLGLAVPPLLLARADEVIE
jgi:putative tryptophan/tyrosine transport system substrate-binding protein